MRKIGLATKLSKLGLETADLDFVSRAVDLERLGNNPKNISQKELIAILKSIF